eukprot:scaffold23973_cov35-Prasinocladus_malaysianus.AAC.2
MTADRNSEWQCVFDRQTLESPLSPQGVVLWERLDYHVFNTIAELRISEMFEVVVDYPDSMPALEVGTSSPHSCPCVLCGCYLNGQQ